MNDKASLYQMKDAVRSEIDRFEWKHSWHLPVDQFGHTDWHNAKTYSECRRVILDHKKYAEEMLRNCYALLLDIDWNPEFLREETSNA